MVAIAACGGGSQQPEPIEPSNPAEAPAPAIADWQPFLDNSQGCILPDMAQQPISDLEWGMFPEAVEAELGPSAEGLQTTIDGGGMMTWFSDQSDGISAEIIVTFAPGDLTLNRKVFSYSILDGTACTWASQP